MMNRGLILADVADGRENNFNLLRMIAASGVLFSHAYPISLGAGAVQPLVGILHGTALGTVCVWVFFAISGFFITQSYMRSPSPRRFLTARALRLFPGLLVVLLVTVAVGSLLTLAPLPEFLSAVPTYLLRNLTLIQLSYDLPGVFATNTYGPAINGSLWTLIYEVLCYLAVLAAGMLGVLHRPKLFWPVFGVLLIGLLVLVPLVPLHDRITTLASLAFPFVLGTAAYIGRAHIPLSLPLAGGLAVVAALAYSTPAFQPLFVLALSYLTFLIGYWRSPVLQAYNRLGDYSYGMYIYAFPVQQLVASYGVTDPWLNIAISLPVTLGCAVLSWHLIEKTALSFKPGSRSHLTTTGPSLR
jgi:peptidoglycan/LPS O-acetylase OafA/YrhL